MKNKNYFFVQNPALSIVLVSAISGSLMTLLDYASDIALTNQNRIYQRSEYQLLPFVNKLFISDLQALEYRAQANLLSPEMIEKKLHKQDFGGQKIALAAAQMIQQRGFEQQQQPLKLKSALIPF